MANKTNIKKGILDFDYIKALNIIDPNYLNKIFITLRGGNSNHVNSEADWYRINNTDLLINLYLDHNKKKLYALSISKIPETGGSNALEKKERGRSKTRGKSPCSKPGRKPSKSPKPRSKKMTALEHNKSEDEMYNVDYEDVDEYGGKKKKRGRKPKKHSIEE
jgi:hypothetical protein